MKAESVLIVFPTRAEAGGFAARSGETDLFSYNRKTDILISGAGMIQTAAGITEALNNRKYDFVLAAGIAGTFDAGRPLGNVVNVITEILGDTGVEQNNSFSSFFQTGIFDGNRFPFENGKLVNKTVVDGVLGKLPKVAGTTVNLLFEDKDKNRDRALKTGATVETMEGAAVFYVCLKKGVPFAQIRALSNYAGERDKSKWEINKALEQLHKIINSFLENID